jgi:2-haloacid dehalogenase
MQNSQGYNKINKRQDQVKGRTSRRDFVRETVMTASGLLFLADSLNGSGPRQTIKAILFDGFPIFDPRPIFEKVRELFPGKGEQLNAIWTSKQFSYQWLRVAAGKYKGFWELTLDALDYATSVCGINLTINDKTEIMNQYKFITVWPDVSPALQKLKSKGLRLGLLSNMQAGMLFQGIRNSNTGELFDHVLSTDQRKTFKPSREAYQLGIDTLQLKREEVLFVAFAAWDVAGAKWFGYPTYWVNRMNTPADRLDAEPDGIGSNLDDLIDFVETKY